jgi:hypothetical protein
MAGPKVLVGRSVPALKKAQVAQNTDVRRLEAVAAIIELQGAGQGRQRLRLAALFEAGQRQPGERGDGPADHEDDVEEPLDVAADDGNHGGDGDSHHSAQDDRAPEPADKPPPLCLVGLKRRRDDPVEQGVELFLVKGEVGGHPSLLAPLSSWTSEARPRGWGPLKCPSRRRAFPSSPQDG